MIPAAGSFWTTLGGAAFRGMLNSRSYAGVGPAVANPFLSRGFHSIITKAFRIDVRLNTPQHAEQVVNDVLMPRLREFRRQLPPGTAGMALLPEFAFATARTPASRATAGRLFTTLVRGLRQMEPGLVLSPGTIAYVTDTTGHEGKRIGYNAGALMCSGPEAGHQVFFKSSAHPVDGWDARSVFVPDRGGQPRLFYVPDLVEPGQRGFVVGHMICSEANSFEALLDGNGGHLRPDVLAVVSSGSPVPLLSPSEAGITMFVCDTSFEADVEGALDPSVLTGEFQSVRVGQTVLERVKPFLHDVARRLLPFWSTTLPSTAGEERFQFMNKTFERGAWAGDEVVLGKVSLTEGLDETRLQELIRDGRIIDLSGAPGGDDGPSWDDAGDAADGADEAGTAADDGSRGSGRADDPSRLPDGDGHGPDGEHHGRKEDPHPDDHPEERK